MDKSFRYLKAFLCLCLVIGLAIGIDLLSPMAMVIFTLPFGILLKAANRGAPRWPIIGSAVGALILLIPFWFLCLYDVHVRLPKEGGGANIGLGVALFILPLILAGTTSVGWIICGGKNLTIGIGNLFKSPWRW